MSYDLYKEVHVHHGTYIMLNYSRHYQLQYACSTLIHVQEVSEWSELTPRTSLHTQPVYVDMDVHTHRHTNTSIETDTYTHHGDTEKLTLPSSCDFATGHCTFRYWVSIMMVNWHKSNLFLHLTWISSGTFSWRLRERVRYRDRQRERERQRQRERDIRKSDNTFAHVLYVMCHTPVTYRKHTVCIAFYGGRVVTNVQKVF